MNTNCRDATSLAMAPLTSNTTRKMNEKENNIDLEKKSENENQLHALQSMIINSMLTITTCPQAHFSMEAKQAKQMCLTYYTLSDGIVYKPVQAFMAEIKVIKWNLEIGIHETGFLKQPCAKSEL